MPSSPAGLSPGRTHRSLKDVSCALSFTREKRRRKEGEAAQLDHPAQMQGHGMPKGWLQGQGKTSAVPPQVHTIGSSCGEEQLAETSIQRFRGQHGTALVQTHK